MIFKKKNKRIKNFDAVIKNKGPQKRKRKRVSFVRKFVFTKYFAGAFILLLVLSVLVYYFLFSGEFEIREVRIEGVNEELANNLDAHYKNIANEKLLFFLDRNNTLFFPKNGFEESALKNIPKIKSVDANLDPPHTLSIHAVERKQKGIWCNYYEVNSGSSECYFYDLGGVVYEEAPGVARGSIIVAIRDTRTPDVVLPQQVLEPETYQYIDTLVEVLGTAYNKPAYVTIEDKDGVSAYYSGSSSAREGGWKVYFSRSIPVIESVENLTLVLGEKIGTRTGELEYIDLRLGNKVFYKYREAEAEESE